MLLAEGANCNSFDAALEQFSAAQDDYADSFEFLLINATGAQDRAAVQAQFANYSSDLPLLIDESQIIPELLGVDVVGEVMEYIWVDSGFATDRDRWVKGADLIPGDRSVVHHILARAVPPGMAGPKIGICPTPCEQGQGERGERSIEERGINLPAYIPGNNARFLEENTGQFVPAGSRMVFQMHYTTSGRATVDESEFGLYFYEDGFEPTEEISSGGVLANDFQIPPNDGDYAVVRTRTIPKDAYALSFYPHMHLRGKRMKWTAQYPDGTEEQLLSVPNYDFNWQMTYELSEPKFIPAGTTIVVEGAFDNSPMNPNNPDPSASVTWGDQSWEEMFIGNMAIKYVDQGGP